MSTVSIDLHDKLTAERRNEVQEYLVWRVEDQEFDWFRLKERKYLKLEADNQGIIKSEIYAGLWLDVKALLEGDLAKILTILQLGLSSPEHQNFLNHLNS